MSRIQIGTRTKMEQSAAQSVAESLRSAVEQRGRATLALPGGRSVAGVLQALTGIAVPWPQIVVMPADERMLPDGEPDLNWNIVAEHLIDPLIERGDLPPQNAQPFRFRPELPDLGLSSFVEQLQLPTDGRGVALVDVVVLGAGEDGHVASLFPGRKELHSDSSSFLFIDDSPKPPPLRITLSPAMVRACQSAVLLFFGAGKSDALQRFTDPAITFTDCPAKIALAARRCSGFADTEAARS